MPLVKLPNGEIASFPDSMSQTEIEGVLHDQFPAPAAQSLSSAPPQETGLARAGGLARNAVMEGLTAGFGAGGDIENALLGPKAMDAARQTLTAFSTADPSLYAASGALVLPSTNELRQLLAPTGWMNNTSLTPTGPVEEYGTAGLRGAASALPSIMMGAPPIASLIEGAAGSMAGQAASDIAPNSPALAGPASIVAGGIAGGLVGAARNALAGNAFANVARQLGSSRTPQEAGIELQEAARDWKANVMPKKEAEAWDPVDAAIPATAPVQLSNFKSALDEVNKSAGSLQPLSDLLTSNIPKQLSNALAKRSVSGFIGDETSSGLVAPWEDARRLRTVLGDAMGNPKLVNEISEQNLKQLYRGITGDLQDTAQSAGALNIFNAANAKSTYLHDFAEGPLSRVIAGVRQSSDDPRPEDVATRLLAGGKRGATDLSALRDEIPDAVDELAAAHLNYSPDAWRKMSPEAKYALVPQGNLRASLDVAAAAQNPGRLVSGLNHLTGATVGDFIGMAAAHGLGMPELYGGALGGLSGLAAPYLGRGIGSMFRPNVLGAEYVGGVGGGSGRGAGQ